MTNNLRFASAETGSDFATFVQRANHLGCQHIRLVVRGELLLASVAVLEREGLLDAHPDVIGMRIYELTAEQDQFDTVVEVRAVLDRLARSATEFVLPLAQPGIAWAGTTPPQSGWEPRGVVAEATLERIAREGIDQVAQANALGAKIVTEVRRQTWGGQELAVGEAPSFARGAAFAAFGLGFLGESEGVATVSTAGAWMRLSTQRGHVLVRG